ncbi:MAG TPA: hypothetical protein VGN64_11620, partial [Dyadobacter sp.]|nr:hypothetical protein [Dyadobacter sp.]
MKQTLLENWKNDQASPGRKIDDLLLEIYGFMPSNGSYPFTMIRLYESESGDLRTEPPLTSRVQLLVITRADYTKAEFADYVTKSREYTDMRSDLRPAFLENYLH